MHRSIRSDTSLQQWASGVRVSGDDRSVVLDGTVSSERAKNLIEQRARDAAGGALIENRIRVDERAGTMDNTRDGLMNNNRDGLMNNPRDSDSNRGQTF